jgi:hypothetical protein
MSMQNAFFAFLHTRAAHPRVRHVLGFPSELAGDDEVARQLPPPDVVVIEEESQGNVFLYRLTRSGEPCGDTWHQSIEDARYQADYEYGDALGEWQDIPHEASDAREFAVAAARNLEEGKP